MAHIRVILVLPLLVGILNCGVKGDPVPYVQLHPPVRVETPAAQAPAPEASARPAAPAVEPATPKEQR